MGLLRGILGVWTIAHVECGIEDMGPNADIQ